MMVTLGNILRSREGCPIMFSTAWIGETIALRTTSFGAIFRPAPPAACAFGSRLRPARLHVGLRWERSVLLSEPGQGPFGNIQEANRVGLARAAVVPNFLADPVLCRSDPSKALQQNKRTTRSE